MKIRTITARWSDVTGGYHATMPSAGEIWSQDGDEWRGDDHELFDFDEHPQVRIRLVRAGYPSTTVA